MSFNLLLRKAFANDKAEFYKEFIPPIEPIRLLDSRVSSLTGSLR